MPHAIIKLAAGRPEALKQRLADAIAQTIMTTLGVDEESVSVSIEDIPMADWTEAVFEPDISGRPDTLYKKPGYGSL